MNELGTARSDAEKAVEAAIVQVAPWKGRRLRYRPVSGGISNTNFRIEVEGEERGYFLKIPGRGTEMFIDRKAAAAASKQAEAIGIGPKTFDYLDHLDIEIAEFIDGRRASTHRILPIERSATKRCASTVSFTTRLPCLSRKPSST